MPCNPKLSHGEQSAGSPCWLSLLTQVLSAWQAAGAVLSQLTIQIDVADAAFYNEWNGLS